MAVNPVSPGSYNSPSVQPQAQTQRVPERAREERTPPPAPETKPIVNTSGQTVGTIVNTKA